MTYEESTKKVHFFCKNIWSYQKKAVPLHSLLRNKCVSIFSRRASIKKSESSMKVLIFLRLTKAKAIERLKQLV